MNVKLYKVHLKSGSSTKLYETPQEAMQEHRGNIVKFEEVFTKPMTKKFETPIVKGEEALLISKRDNDDLATSKECGYAVTYNSPSLKKIYDGMVYLELSDDSVLVAEVVRLERYSKLIHHHWKGPGYRPDKEWQWAIYHRKGQIISRELAEQKYGKLKGTQGGISYVKINNK
jgi:hypothetical protein